MSVSHPLAADDAHPTAGCDPNTAGRRDQVDAPDKRADTSTSRAGSRALLPEQVIVAPEHLGLESRIEFREVASTLIDRITTGTGRLVIECSRLKSIDSAGLNALILVQRRAAKRRVHVIVRELDDELLALLVLTKLDNLFEMQDGQER